MVLKACVSKMRGEVSTALTALNLRTRALKLCWLL
jgi:hypothetical protein